MDGYYADQSIANIYMKKIKYIRIQKVAIDKFMEGYKFVVKDSINIFNDAILCIYLH